MKNKSVLSLFLAIGLMTTSMVPGVSVFAEETTEQETAGEETAAEETEQTEESDTGCWEEIAGDGATSYENLFSVILDDSCYDIWYNKCKELVGEDQAEETVKMLQDADTSELYGESAVEEYGDQDSFRFDSWYINDAQLFTFKDEDGAMTAEITKTDGSTETHTYEYLGVYQIGADETMVYGGEEFCPAFDCDVYQSTDDAGEFTYFFFRDDSMETTYHIEFRYGSDLEELQGLMKGEYAYWLAAGYDTEADEETLENVIGLFCEENAG